MSHALNWIKKRRTILSISALNRWLKLPPRTLQTYLETGRLQNAGKHLPVIEEKMAPIMANDIVIKEYIRLLITQWKENADSTQACSPSTYSQDRSIIDITNAKQEQAVNCLKILNDLLCRENHPAITYLHNQVKLHLPAFLPEFKHVQHKQAS